MRDKPIDQRAGLPVSRLGANSAADRLLEFCRQARMTDSDPARFYSVTADAHAETATLSLVAHAETATLSLVDIEAVCLRMRELES